MLRSSVITLRAFSIARRPLPAPTNSIGSRLSSSSAVPSSAAALAQTLQRRHHFGHDHSHSHSHGGHDHGHGSTGGAGAAAKAPRTPITRNRRVDSHHSHGYLNGCCHGHSHGRGNDLDLAGTNNFGAEGNHAPVLYVKPGELEDHVRGENLKACRTVTMVGASTNLVYCFLKISLGSQGGSVALLADGIHALVDFGADLISFCSVHVTHRRYARSKFPFGLGRFETLTSLFIAVMLLSGGSALLFSALDEIYDQYVEQQQANASAVDGSSSSNSNEDGVSDAIAAKDSTCEVAGCGHNHKRKHGHDHHDDDHGIIGSIFGALLHHDHDDDLVLVEKDEHGNTRLLWPMIAVSVSCLLVKQGMYRWARKVGERAGSRIVVANAYHHRADSWTSAIALVGVAGQVAGIPFVDGIAGAVVSGLILRTGAFVMRNSVLELFDYQNSDVRCLAEHIRHTVTDHYNAEIPNMACLYATRHGHQYSLSATMLVRAGETADLAKLCKAQRIIERVARQEHKVALASVSVSLHEIEYDRRVPPQHLGLFAETESLAVALRELKAYRPVHKKIMEGIAESKKKKEEGESAEAVKKGPAAEDTEHPTPTALPDSEVDADEAAHQMHHRRRRVVEVFIRLEEFYGAKILPFESVFVNWQKNEIDASILYDEERERAMRLSHDEHHRLEMLQEDLEAVCYALGFDLIKIKS